MYWEKIEFGERMKKLLTDEFKRQSVDIET